MGPLTSIVYVDGESGELRSLNNTLDSESDHKEEEETDSFIVEGDLLYTFRPLGNVLNQLYLHLM